MARPRSAPEVIERGLTAVALYGNTLAASQATGIPDRTLRGWRTDFADRYQEIEATRAKLIDQACIEEFRQIVLTGTKATLKAIHKASDALDQENVRDPAAIARNLATTAAIATDKLAIMEGRPTSIVEHRTADDVMRGLAGQGYVDSTADEDPTANTVTPFKPASAETTAPELAA